GRGGDRLRVHHHRALHLAAVAGQRGELAVQVLGDVDVQRRAEVQRRRAAVVQDAGTVPGRRERRRHGGAVVLVRVLGRVDVDDVRADRVDHLLDERDGGRVRYQPAVGQAAPDQARVEHPRGRVLLGPPVRRAGTVAAVGEDQHGQGVAGRPVGRERAAAAQLDVVGVGPDREDATHQATLRRWRHWRYTSDARDSSTLATMTRTGPIPLPSAGRLTLGPQAVFDDLAVTVWPRIVHDTVWLFGTAGVANTALLFPGRK